MAVDACLIRSLPGAWMLRDSAGYYTDGTLYLLWKAMNIALVTWGEACYCPAEAALCVRAGTAAVLQAWKNIRAENVFRPLRLFWYGVQHFSCRICPDSWDFCAVSAINCLV